MKSKVIKSVILLVLFLLFASWFYRIIFVLLGAVVWRHEIKRWHKGLYFGLIAVLSVALFCVLPRFRYNTGDRVRLIYQDENCNPVLPPVSHYLFNVLFPEEEICNFAIMGVRLIPNNMPMVDWLVQEFKYDDSKGNIKNFGKCFSDLNWSGDFMMSGTTSQLANMVGLPETRSVYLIEPEDFDEKKQYPLVFFMHGYMGNWKLYTSIMKELKDCVVLCVGTMDWSGTFTKKDIENLFARQLPFVKNMGYQIDEKDLHIIGLSNGGSAANIAYQNFSRKFKTITFLSTGIHQTYPISSKVLMIGGGKDHSSGSLRGAHAQLKANGTSTDIYWQDDETHFILVNRKDEIVEFLNRNLQK